MAATVRVHSDISKAMRKLENTQKDALPAAIAGAINKTIKNVQVEAAKLVKASVGLKASGAKDSMPIRKASKRIQSADITVKPKAINAIEYVSNTQKRVGAFRDKTGVRVKTNKTYTITGSFIAPAKYSGKLIVLKRQGQGRLPTKTIYGPSIYNTFKNPRTQRALQTVADSKWKENFRRELEYRLSKLNNE